MAKRIANPGNIEPAIDFHCSMHSSIYRCSANASFSLQHGRRVEGAILADGIGGTEHVRTVKTSWYREEWTVFRQDQWRCFSAADLLRHIIARARVSLPTDSNFPPTISCILQVPCSHRNLPLQCRVQINKSGRRTPRLRTVLNEAVFCPIFPFPKIENHDSEPKIEGKVWSHSTGYSPHTYGALWS